MDGSNVRTLVGDGMRCATSLHVDLPTARLYWADQELNVIDSIGVDGTKRRVRLLPAFTDLFVMSCCCATVAPLFEKFINREIGQLIFKRLVHSIYTNELDQ